MFLLKEPRFQMNFVIASRKWKGCGPNGEGTAIWRHRYYGDHVLNCSCSGAIMAVEENFPEMIVGAGTELRLVVIPVLEINDDEIL